MAFKMKRSPVKGKLKDFFSNLGNQLKRNRRDIGGEFKGVKQKDKPGGFGNSPDKDKDGTPDFIQKPKAAPKGQEVVSSSRIADGNYFNFSGKKGDKYKYRTKSYINPYNNQIIPGTEDKEDITYEFQRPGSNTWEKSKTKAGNQAIDDLFFGQGAFGLQDNREYRTNSDYTGSVPPLKKRGFKMPGYGKRK
mgnify:CR=1 FL=1|tara:strand:- start:7 stop:582 length:576 start_codon:yes stop_codon:yes gene_type:complete